MKSRHWLSSTCDLRGDTLRIRIPPDLPAVCPIPGISFYRSVNKSENYLIDKFNLLEQIGIEILLFEHLLPFVFSKQPVHSVEEVKYSLADVTMTKALRQGRLWISKIDKFALIPLETVDPGKARAYRRIMALVDPESSLAKLFFPDEEVFPESQFFEHHRIALKNCGLQMVINRDIVLERIRYFAQYQNAEELLKKVSKLVNSPIDVATLEEENITEIRTSSWLPANSPSGQLVKCSPLQSRAIEDSELCNHVLNILDSKVHPDWKRLLGWNTVIEEKVLLDQLDVCRKVSSHSQIDQVLGYLYRQNRTSSILSKQCLRTARQIYVEPSQAILPGGLLDNFPLTPFLETVDRSFADKHARLLSDMKIKASPSFEDLIKVQQAIMHTSNGVALQAEQLSISRNLLEIASLIVGPEHLGSFRVPDHEGRLVLLADIVYGDPSVTVKDADIRYTHPDISTGLITRLGIESVRERTTRLQIAIEDEDEDEYVPREELSTIIADTLRRYDIMATFSEFLANADDCEASKISWILDECEQGPYNSQRLMTSELVDLQGAALFSHNDQIFSAKDFEGYKDIGRGGKQGDATTIGMFGRGSMSMYHFTDNPMILSGDAMVILDPQQRLLPSNKFRRRKLGVKLSLDTFKHNYPDQLLPFHGLCSYDKDMSFYQGTLFRMPLNRPSPTRRSMSGFEVQKLLDDYYAIARESLLFLENVGSIEFSLRSQPLPRWTVTAEHSNNFSGGVHQQIRLCGQKSENTKFEETWHVGLMDIENVPAEVPIPNVGKMKLIECGVAACVSTGSPERESALSLTMPTRRLYCKLPTTYETGLPVALNATFAMTGDRRSITIDESREESSRWNHWLLKTCLPDMYIEFLRYLAPIVGKQVFEFWPGTIARENTLSKLIQTSFWEKIVRDQYSQYPVYPISDVAISSGDAKTLKSRKSGARKLHPVVSLESAEFDLMPDGVSNLLGPLIGSLCPQLVRPPEKLRRLLHITKTSYVTIIDSSYLAACFKETQGLTCLLSFLSTFEDPKRRSKVLEVLLLETVPELVQGDEKRLHILDGCRILPRSDNTMSMLKIMDPNESTSTIDWALLPSSEERRIFKFATASLVAPSLFSRLIANEYVTPEFIGRNPIQDLMDSSFNIRQIENHDMKQLLTRKGSPLASPNDLLPDETWFSQLWSYLREKLSKLSDDEPAKCKTVFDLGDCPIYRWFDGDRWQYLTPNEFEGGAFLLEPVIAKEVRLCEELERLKLIDRDHVEPALITEEYNLKEISSFRRMARALRRFSSKSDLSIDVIMRNRLSKTSLKVR